jgi:hypothetical protein
MLTLDQSVGRTELIARNESGNEEVLHQTLKLLVVLDVQRRNAARPWPFQRRRSLERVRMEGWRQRRPGSRTRNHRKEEEKPT